MIAMTLLAPGRLALLIVPALLGALYLVQQLRRPRDAARFTNLALLDDIVPRRSGWWRHLPIVPLLLGLVMMVIALARPYGTEPEGVGATLVVAVDVSLSMNASDVDPTRLVAAQKAARAMIDAAPEGLRIGLIAFAGTPRVLVNPTTDRGDLRSAIDGLQLGQGTAIGEAIYTGVDVLQREIKAQDKRAAAVGATSTTLAPGTADTATPTDPTATPNTPRTSVRLVVMSDGKTTIGRPDDQAAAAAAAAGIAVDTIAFGTADGFVQFRGETVSVPVEPGPLSDIAKATRGQFYETASGDTLARVFKQISGSLGTKTVKKENPVPYVAAGFVLLSLAVAGALALTQRFP